MSVPAGFGLLPLTHCPDCGRPRVPGDGGCPDCGLSAEAFSAIAKLQKMYLAACIELIAANQTGIAQIVAIGPRDF